MIVIGVDEGAALIGWASVVNEMTSASSTSTTSPSASCWASVVSTRRKVANQPPRNKAVRASQPKIETRARRARTASSSLTMGKIALRASRAERRATRIAMTVAPLLIAARISKMVGKDVILRSLLRNFNYP